MQKKVLAVICMLAILVGVMAAAVPAPVSAAADNTYLVGYAKTNIDPIDPEGKYRTVNLTSQIGSYGDKSAYKHLPGLLEGTDSKGKTTYTYTVADYSDEVGVSNAVPDGYFRVPLGGYAGQEDRMSQGIMDDSGDGTIDQNTDGMRATCILISDGTNIIALVGIDAISADTDIITAVKTKVHTAIPEIPRANIFVTASHSHSGVYTSVFGANYDSAEKAKDTAAVEKAKKSAAQLAYRALATDRIAEAIIEAYNTMEAATIEKASLSIVDDNGKANMNFVRHYNVTKTPHSSWYGTKQEYVSGDNFGGNQSSDGILDALTYSYSISPVAVADNTMNVLRITYTDGSQTPILFANWRAHPKINSTASSDYGTANRPYSSADYVGAFRIAMEAAGYRTSFYQGTAGNMNAHSNNSSETNSKTKGSKGQQGGLYGQELAKYALTAMGKTTFETVTGGEILVQDQPFTGGDTVYPASVAKAAQLWHEAYEKGQAKYNYDYNGFKFNSYYHASTVYSRTKDYRNGDGSYVDVTFKGTAMVLNAVTIGDNLALISTANELYDRYSDTGSFTDNDWLDLNSLGYGNAFVMGYTNGSKGYLPNKMAYDYNAGSSTYGKGSYEANTTGYAQGDGEKMVAAFKEMLQSMKTVNPVIEAPCQACGLDKVEWTALHGIYDDTVIDPGHYYLAGDAAAPMNYQKQIGGKICIDLMGHTYANQSTVTGRSLVVNNGGVLSIMDSSAGKTGKLQGQGYAGTLDGGVIAVNEGGTLNLYGGTVERVIAEGQTVRDGGAIWVNGTFNMYGGTVTGGKATNEGDNVFVTDKGTFAMSGGTITGGVHVKAANKKVSLSGNAVIYDEKAEKNLFLDNDGSNELKTCALTEGAKIGITAVRYLAKEAQFGYFVADEGTYLTKLNSKVFAGDRFQCECGGKAVGKYGHTCEKIVFAPWPGSGTPPTFGNFYLIHNIKLENSSASAKNISVGGTLHLDLNGKNIINTPAAGATEANTKVFMLDSTDVLTITDSTSGAVGTITRDLKNLEENAKTATYSGLCVNMAGSATFRMYDGIVDGTGQRTTAAGGVVAATAGTNTIQLYGGKIIGATGNYGGAIFSNGTVLLAGGEITGGQTIRADGAGGVFVSSTNGNLTLTGDATVTGNVKNNTAISGNIFCDATKLTVAGTYTGTAGVVVSNPTVGKVIGISKNADISGAKLTVDNEELYEIVTSGDQLKLDASVNAAVKQTNGSDVKYYNSVEEALADYKGGNAYLTLLKDADAVTLTAPTKIDLFGHDIASVTLNGGSLEVKDSATDDFTVEDADGYGTIAADVAATVSAGYIRIEKDGKASFHRLDLTLTELSLRPAAAGFYYGGQFGGDEVLAERISEFGMSLRANGTPDEAYITADTEKKTHYAETQWQSGGNNKANSVILSGILKEDNGYIINKRNAEIPVCGVAYVVLDGQMIFGEPKAYTLHEFMELADEKCVGKTGVRVMYETYERVMRGWNIPNIKAESFAGKTATFVGDSITYGAGLNDGEWRYWEHLQSGLRMATTVNMGISGSCISSNNDRGHNYTPLIDRYQNIPATDLIFIFMGTNDWGHNTMIETKDYNASYHKESQTRTLATDLNTVIDYLQETHKNSKIVLITPIVRGGSETLSKNKIGRTLKDYVAAVEAVGEAQGVTVLSIYDETAEQLPITEEFFRVYPDDYSDESLRGTLDKVHPNAKGHKVLADIILEQLNSKRTEILK